MAFLKNWPVIILILISFALGIFTTLSVDSLRYTSAVSPSPIVDIEPKDLYAIIKNENPDNYLFYDVRTKGEYDLLHAELSSNVPITDLFDTWSKLPRDKERKIYLICKGGRLAGVAYRLLQLHGFRNIVRVTGGVQEWSADGLPTVSPTLFPEKQ